jgi:hypothetical protein
MHIVLNSVAPMTIRIPPLSHLKRQDNDLIIIESVDAAAPFKRNFDAQFAAGEILPVCWLVERLRARRGRLAQPE